MSNDVHLAKVSRIPRQTDATKIGLMTGVSGSRLSGNRMSLGPMQEQGLHVDAIESPDATQRDTTTTTESDNNVSSCSTLDIVNKVENLSLHQLETKVRDLSRRLQQAEEQRLTVQNQLVQCNSEKELCLKRLEIVSAAHECRITEMHCVIAELSKKLRSKQENTIMEEQEPEGSELSYQEGSIYNSELNLTNPDAECQTDPLEEMESQMPKQSEAIVSRDDAHNKHSENIKKGQIEALQEEVLHLKAQIALLQSEIAISNNNLSVGHTVEESPTIEYYKPDMDVNQSTGLMDASNANQLRASKSISPRPRIKQQQQHQYQQHEQQQQHYEQQNNNSNINNNSNNNVNIDDLELNDLNNASTLTAEDSYVTSPHQIPAIPKMAERIRLKCASKNDIENITAMDLRNKELKNANIVEHLVADLKLNSHRLIETFTEPKQLDNELQRLQRKIEQLKIQNTVLSLTLDESKEHCEHLYLLCGKYESNAVALQAALNCSDRAIEAYDVMLALLESKLALINDNHSTAAEDSRRSVETVARHLLEALDNEKNLCENSLGPWKDSFSIPEKVSVIPWTSNDDNCLRYHVSKLKGRRAAVQNTIVQLESPFSDSYEKSRLKLEKRRTEVNALKDKNVNNHQLDLEMAVLMQELLNLREENIAQKLKTEQAERDKEFANDRIHSLQETLEQLQLQLQFNGGEERFHNSNDVNDVDHDDVNDDDDDNVSSDCGDGLFKSRKLPANQETSSSMKNTDDAMEHIAHTEQQLLEALTRKSELKRRIQTLIASVTEKQKISHQKYEQLQHNVMDLQKTNQNLTQIIEQNKRKHQSRIRKLEQKIMDLTMQNEINSHSSLHPNSNYCYPLQQQQQHQQHPQQPHLHPHNSAIEPSEMPNPCKYKHLRTSPGQHVKSPPEICVPETTL